MSLRGSHSAQGSPTALLKSCVSVGVWRRRRKPFMPAAPSSYCSACPQPCLSLCTCRNSSRDCLLLCKPQLHRSLCSSSLCAAAGCLGKGFWGFDKYSLFHIGFPLPGAVLLRQWCSQQCQHCSNKVFAGSQLCQAPHTLGRVL